MNKIISNTKLKSIRELLESGINTINLIKSDKINQKKSLVSTAQKLSRRKTLNESSRTMLIEAKTNTKLLKVEVTNLNKEKNYLNRILNNLAIKPLYKK